jgi:hypothetical protein
MDRLLNDISVFVTTAFTFFFAGLKTTGALAVVDAGSKNGIAGLPVLR